MQNAAMGAAVTASNAAAVAMTFRVLQLVSTASIPALPPGQAQQLLQSVNSAASQAAPNDRGVLAVCLAETLAFQNATGCLVGDQTNLMLLSQASGCFFCQDTCFLLPALCGLQHYLTVQTSSDSMSLKDCI